ncbi:Uncharacterised protein [uncultured archaeon]|nr:Uncharacterised protein [uncultured archaeon]
MLRERKKAEDSGTGTSPLEPHDYGDVRTTGTLTPDHADAMLYLGATLLYSKQIREEGDQVREREELRKITPQQAMEAFGKGGDPGKKLAVLIPHGPEAIKRMAQLWRETHPKGEIQ